MRPTLTSRAVFRGRREVRWSPKRLVDDVSDNLECQAGPRSGGSRTTIPRVSSIGLLSCGVSDMQVDAEWAGQVLDWLDQRRHPVGAFLKARHVGRERLGHGEKISVESLAAIMEFGEACTGDRHFGLHRGGEFRPEIGGVLAYLAMCSETVEQGFDNLKRYVSISSDGFAIDFNRDEAACKLVLHVSDPTWARCNHLSEFAFARFLKCLRLITNSRLRPLRVEFVHPRKEPDSECQHFFGSTVSFACKVDAVEFARDVLAMRTHTSDKRLSLFLQRYADGLLQQARSKGEESFADAVAAAIVRLLPSGDVSLSKVARLLNMSERTTRRRLERAGLSFNELLRRMRQDLAETWLETGEFDIKHISFLVGYSDVSAFSRAYKRWTGRSPSRGRS
jgi:AraC-like DNA-binding protein